jgi:hypothetical protein
MLRLALIHLGGFGAYAPALAVPLGLALPPLAALAHALLLPAVLLMLAMTLALAEPGRLRGAELRPAALLALGNLAISPAIAAVALMPLELGAARPWLILLAGCPSAGAAALIGQLLGLPLRPVLLGQLAGFFALPVTAPLLAAQLGGGVHVDAWALAWQVALLVGGPALLGLVLRRALGPARRLAQAPVLRGLGVLGLSVIGLALGDGLVDLAMGGALTAAVALSLILASVIGAGVGAAMGALAGGGLVAAFALAGGVRNVSLLWGSASGLAPPEAEVILRLGLAWTLFLPALISAGAALRHARRRVFAA